MGDPNSGLTIFLNRDHTLVNFYVNSSRLGVRLYLINVQLSIEYWKLNCIYIPNLIVADLHAFSATVKPSIMPL